MALCEYQISYCNEFSNIIKVISMEIRTKTFTTKNKFSEINR